MKKKVVPVVTGFFGITPEGHVTTVGRSGTDYTAAVVGVRDETRNSSRSGRRSTGS